MTRLLVNKTMSRNGGTLICQLLEGKSELFFPPFVIDLAIKTPKCWPLAGFSTVSRNDFSTKMISKLSFWEGGSWFDSENLPLTLDSRVDKLAFSAASKLDGFVSEYVEPGNLEEAFLAFLGGVVRAYGSGVSQAMPSAKYFVIDADHSFTCGLSEAAKNFKEIRFMQVIRNVYDVMASRKNMLLHHAGLFGDPRAFTLRDKVVKSEVSRWLLSVVSAVRDQEAAPTQCVTLQFESLHKRREDLMRQMAEFLDIPFTSSLLIEGRTEVATIVNKDSQFASSSSLRRVTRGKLSTVIGSSLKTLNDAENAVLANVFGGVSYDWPEGADIPEFQDFLGKFLKRHDNAIRNNPFLETLNSLSTAEEKMEAYSSLNFGRANVREAFVT